MVTVATYNIIGFSRKLVNPFDSCCGICTNRLTNPIMIRIEMKKYSRDVLE